LRGRPARPPSRRRLVWTIAGRADHEACGSRHACPSLGNSPWARLFCQDDKENTLFWVCLGFAEGGMTIGIRRSTRIQPRSHPETRFERHYVMSPLLSKNRESTEDRSESRDRRARSSALGSVSPDFLLSLLILLSSLFCSLIVDLYGTRGRRDGRQGGSNPSFGIVCLVLSRSAFHIIRRSESLFIHRLRSCFCSLGSTVPSGGVWLFLSTC
jgi:hypothetical protein